MRHLVAIAFGCFLFSCGSTSHKAEVMQAEGMMGGRAMMADASLGAAAPTPARQIKKTAYLLVEVDRLKPAIEKVESIIKKHQGQIESTSATQDDSAHLSGRVPPEQLDAALQSIAAVGQELERTISSEDLTEYISDMSVQLKTQKALHARLTKLLERAKDVKDILELERELTRLQIEIEQLEGSLKRAKTDVALSIVNVHLKEKLRLGPVGWVGYQLGRGLKWLFVWE